MWVKNNIDFTENFGILKKIKRARRGASLLGYGLIVGLIAVVALGATTNVGLGVNKLFGGVSNSMDDVVSDAGGGDTGGGGTPAPATVGTARSWGEGTDGRLGNGGAGDQTSSVSVNAPPTGTDVWKSTSGGSYHSCALQDVTNAPFCWGKNNLGQLGNGTTTSETSPVAVDAPATGSNIWEMISSGEQHSCGLQSGTNEIFCWGGNWVGQLGIGNTTAQSSPVRINAPSTGTNTWLEVSSGDGHVCAIQSGTNEGFCWGYGPYGQLGHGSTSNTNEPTTAVNTPPTGTNKWASIASAGYSTCGIQLTTNEAFCWGNGVNSQLGNGATSDEISPVAVNNPPTGANSWQMMSAGYSHTCGIQTGTDALFCWGFNSHGQIGDNSTTHRTSPVAVNAPPTGTNTWSSFAGGYHHSCAIQSGTNAVFCWGENDNGQLGNGATSDELTPVAVGGGDFYSSISIGPTASHSLGVVIP